MQVVKTQVKEDVAHTMDGITLSLSRRNNLSILSRAKGKKNKVK